MKNRLFCNRQLLRPATSQSAMRSRLFLLLCMLVYASAFASSDAPSWAHALSNVSLPSFDEKTEAVLLYSDTSLTVVSADKVKRHVREAYKILRPEGRHYGTVFVYADSHRKVTSMHGWCLPTNGKDYEVKDKDAVEVSPPSVEGGELMTDLKVRVLTIPAPDPGNIIAYEYDVEEQPSVFQDVWYFQEFDPVRETHYSLQLPSGWEYRASWLNFPDAKPIETGGNQFQWTVTDVKGIRHEAHMPPFRGVAGQMIVSFFPPGGTGGRNSFSNWEGMGAWYTNLLSGRLDASPQIQQEVAALIAGKTTPLQKMRAVAEFVQHDIRYVAIELGIGDWQPHSAAEVLAHRYGDCKDKVTLMRSMLAQAGIDSYHVVINVQRGAVRMESPAYVGEFNHAILAIKLPDTENDPSLLSVLQHPKLGKILFFDPTDELTPLGELRGALQSNYGLLVADGHGELVDLPQQATTTTSILRTGTLNLSATGTLSGDVKEVRVGDRASEERWRLRTVTREVDRIKPIEEELGNSLTHFQITRATILNLQQKDQPFGFNYSFQSENYAKTAGNLLLVRPRVLGNKSSGFLETKEPRKFSIELEGPSRDMDVFEIALPTGYVVDELPAPVDVDYTFASYHSKTVAEGSLIRYSRTFEVKELTIPVERSEDLRKFYRIIANDERSTVVLKQK